MINRFVSMLMLLVFPVLYVDVQSPNLHPKTKLVVKHQSNELTPLTSLSMTNTPSIITKTPAALLLIQGGRRGEEPPTPPHQHTQTQGPQNIPSLTIATQEQHTLSWRSGDPGIRGGLGRAGPFAVFIVQCQRAPQHYTKTRSSILSYTAHFIARL